MQYPSFSVPFRQISSRLIEQKNVDIFLYTYEEQYHFEKFKVYSAYFVGYLKLWEPIDDLKMQMRLMWVIFISEILKEYKHFHKGTETIHSALGSLKSFRKLTPGTISKVIKRFRELSTKNIVEDILGLDYIILTESDTYKNIWGSRYWLFFHHTSFCVNHYGQDLICSMADLMLNIKMIIVCPICYHHLSQHNLLEEVTVRMRETLDPITVMYNFHNKVNASAYSHEFSHKNFCEMYQCKIKGSKKMNYIYSIKI